MVDAAKPILTITGVSGFIGSQVCLDFLKSGEFNVRGTVRDAKNEAKVAPLRRAFGEHFQNLELVEADLLDAESLHRAIAGSTYVVHTASPFYFPKNEEDVVKPAVEGTMAVLKACSASHVKRLVITSSCAAILVMAAEDKPDLETGFYDESCWSNPQRKEGMVSYVKSKTLAERAAWDYQRSLPEDQRFEIVTVNPCFVMGPTLVEGSSTSSDYVENLFNGSKTEVGTGGMGIVDVRNVSKMHLEAIRRSGVANQRFIAYSERVYPKQVVDWLHEEFGSKGYKVTLKEADGVRDREARVSNQKAKEHLGIEWISAKDAFIAMAQSLIDLGRIKKSE